jgi:XTP/dITP diphosphohydrolase
VSSPLPAEASGETGAALLLATTNPGKLREFRRLFPKLRLLSPADLKLQLNVEETGASFHENATLKARAFAHASGLISMADDSGLEVDGLGGDPGVRSARYGGDGLDDAGRCLLLLHNLKDATPDQRRARFRCCIVAVAPDGRVCHGEGACEGVINGRPKGDSGFGYDPVFVLPRLGKTMAELTPEMKNEISHRARAAECIRPLLSSVFSELAGGS